MRSIYNILFYCMSETFFKASQMELQQTHTVLLWSIYGRLDYAIISMKVAAIKWRNLRLTGALIVLLLVVVGIEVHVVWVISG